MDVDKKRSFYERNLKLTKQDIQKAVNPDDYVIQTVNCMTELNKAINMLVKRLREWYSLYNPEASNNLKDHAVFTDLILKKTKKELLKEFKVDYSMGADLSDEDLSPIMSLAKQVNSMYSLKSKLDKYLEKTMNSYCPNVTAITGHLVGAKLLEHAHSLKRMAELPASTVQLLGAEKALFRHMRSNAKPPKYGVIFSLPMIQRAHPKQRGKVARAFADKISIAAKVDYFKGEFIGDKLKKQLEKKFHDY